jgi:hypothetical protein
MLGIDLMQSASAPMMRVVLGKQHYVELRAAAAHF